MLTKQTMNKENLHNGDGVVFNKKLFELLGFFKILGPKNSFCFKLFLAISIWISLTIVFSILGIVYNVLYGFINNDQLTYLIIFLYTNYLLVLLKLITFILNNNNILKVLDITKINFMQSHQCKFQVGEVLKLRNSNKKITTFYVFLFCIVAIIWSLFPIAYNILIKQKTSENRSIIGVMDLYYPITLQSYQTYYILFNINEVLLGLWLIWATLIYDLFLFTSFWVFAKHYETLTLAFENFNFNGNGKTETFQMYNNLIAIISDCQNVNIKLREFYSIVRFTVIIQVGISSSTFVITMYLISSQLLTGTYEIIDLSKYCVALGAFSAQLAVNIYFLDKMNEKGNGVNFGLYCCDWTAMDIHFKKAFLLAMKINNATRIEIKVTPTNVVNSQCCLKALKISYSILSVMLKTKIKNTNNIQLVQEQTLY